MSFLERVLVSPEAVDRARWHQNSIDSWTLKCTMKDGGYILATIKKEGTAYTWSVLDACDWWSSRRSAMREARRIARLKLTPPRRLVY